MQLRDVILGKARKALSHSIKTVLRIIHLIKQALRSCCEYSENTKLPAAGLGTAMVNPLLKDVATLVVFIVKY